MSINLLSTLQSKFSDSFAANSESFFDEDRTNTGNAANSSFAAIIAGMIQKVDSEKGAKDLFKVLKNEKVADYDLKNIFARSPQTVNGLVNRGTHFLPSIFPDKLREATNTIAAESKVSKNTSSKVAKICSPLALSALAEHVQANNLDVNGLKSLLNDQKGSVQSALSEDFFENAELSSFGWVKKAPVVEAPKPRKIKKEKPVKVPKEKKVVAKKVKKAAVAEAAIAEGGAVAKGGMGFLKWLLPLFLVLGAIWLIATKGCSGVENIAPIKPIAKMPAIENIVKNPFGKINDAAMGLLNKIKFGAGSVGSQMMAFIKGNGDGAEGRFRFTNLNFASGSATIAGESGLEVDNLSSILKAYEEIKVKVEGYTDSQGKAESNQQLSERRANAVKTRLIAAGISEDRISMEGFGAANPVATNDTAEGRAENRRIEVIIVK